MCDWKRSVINAKFVSVLKHRKLFFFYFQDQKEEDNKLYIYVFSFCLVSSCVLNG